MDEPVNMLTPTPTLESILEANLCYILSCIEHQRAQSYCVEDSGKNLSRNELCNTASLLMALSGGSDSIAMLSILKKIQKNKYPRMNLAAAYINHGLQSLDAQQEEYHIVQEFCSIQDIPLYASLGGMSTEGGHEDASDNLHYGFLDSFLGNEHTVGVDSVEEKTGHKETVCKEQTSSEEAARNFRYKHLLGIAKERGCQYIVTAHHLEDLYETCMLRILEGRGLQGMMGIPMYRSIEEDPPIYVIRPGIVQAHKSGQLLRPISKTELSEEVSKAHYRVHHDESNAMLMYRRNVFRNEISTLIQQNFPQSIAQVVAMSEKMQSLLEEDIACTKSLWFYGMPCNTDTQLSLPTRNILSISRVSFEALTNFQKRQMLYHGLNYFGVAAIKARFLEEILSVDITEEKKSFFIMHTEVVVDRELITMRYTRNEKHAIILEQSYTMQIYNSYEEYDSQLHLLTEDYAIARILHTKGTLYFDTLRKKDYILQSGHKVCIRDRLAPHCRDISWSLVPVLKDDLGIVAAIGELYLVPTIIRDIFDEHKKMLYSRVCLKIAYNRVLVHPLP